MKKIDNWLSKGVTYHSPLSPIPNCRYWQSNLVSIFLIYSFIFNIAVAFSSSLTSFWFVKKTRKKEKKSFKLQKKGKLLSVFHIIALLFVQKSLARQKFKKTKVKTQHTKKKTENFLRCVLFIFFFFKERKISIVFITNKLNCVVFIFSLTNNKMWSIHVISQSGLVTKIKSYKRRHCKNKFECYRQQ